MYMPFDAREHMQTPMHVQVHGIARACTGGDICKHLRVRDAFLEAPLQPEAGLPGAGTFTPDVGDARACLIICVRAPAVRHGGAQRTHNTPRMHAQAWIRGGGLRSGGAGTMRRDSRGPRASCVCVRGRGPGGRHHPPRSACARAQPRNEHSLPGISRGDAGERAPRPRQGVAHPPLSARYCLCGHHARRISVGDLLGLGGKQ